jgi:methyltransferase (TIGR00027 family)
MDMSDEVLPGVSRTAVWVAGMRAAEGDRADPWFDDQFAGVFVSAVGGDVTLGVDAMPPGTKEYVAIRTRFLDEQVRIACAAGIRQVVLLAAGLDCRAFRLDWPDGVRLFELDLADMFAFKEPVLASVGAQARCRRVVVEVDLRGQWADALTAGGFNQSAVTLWLAEGLLMYLDQTHGDQLLATVTELSAPGSRAAFDYLEPVVLDRLAMRTLPEQARQMVTHLRPTKVSPADWLAMHGWRLGVFRLPALGEQYDRPMPVDADMVALNAVVLAAASR